MIGNVPLLQKALEHIDAHPEEWNQRSWGHFTDKTACGTACCLAGHIALLDGWVPVPEAGVSAWDGVKKDGSQVIIDVPKAAAKALNAHDGDFRLNGEWLFADYHSREALWLLAYQLTDGQINLPADIVRAVSRDKTEL